MKKMILAGVVFFCCFHAAAQEQNQSQSQTPVQNKESMIPVTDSLRAPEKTTATVLAGLIYAPYLHFYGRTDQFRSHAYLPTLNIQFDSVGLYASGIGVLLDNKFQETSYAGTIIEAGYRWGKTKGLTGNVYANKFLYSTDQLPQSALDEQLGVNLNYLTKPINFSATGSAAFSDERTDIFASAGINRSFRKKLNNKSMLIFTPTYVLNAGSQNFTNVRYKDNLLTPITGQDEAVFEDNRTFKLLSHDITFPVIYARKHIYLIATPSIVIPENVIIIPGYPELSENAKKLFYVNLTFLYTFKM